MRKRSIQRFCLLRKHQHIPYVQSFFMRFAQKDHRIRWQNHKIIFQAKKPRRHRQQCSWRRSGQRLLQLESTAKSCIMLHRELPKKSTANYSGMLKRLAFSFGWQASPSHLQLLIFLSQESPILGELQGHIARLWSIKNLKTSNNNASQQLFQPKC